MGFRKKLIRIVKRHPVLLIVALYRRDILAGFKLYKSLLEKYVAKGKRLYYIEYQGLGDAYVSSALLDEKGLIYKDSILVVPGRGAAKAAELFPYGGTEVVSMDEVFRLRQMQRFYGKELMAEPLLYEPDHMVYCGILRYMSGLKNLDFIKMMEIGIKKNVKGFNNAGKKEKAYIEPCNTKKVEEIFTQNDLKTNRTALLSPYINGHELNFSSDVYREMAQILIKKGYSVCTNSSDPVKEPVIEGTIPICVDLGLLQSFCEMGGLFIGSRSGLCDIVADSDCRKIFLYDVSEFIGVSTWKEFFSLKNAKGKGEVTELTMPNDKEKLLAILETI